MKSKQICQQISARNKCSAPIMPNLKPLLWAIILITTANLSFHHFIQITYCNNLSPYLQSCKPHLFFSLHWNNLKDIYDHVTFHFKDWKHSIILTWHKTFLACPYLYFPPHPLSHLNHIQ